MLAAIFALAACAPTPRSASYNIYFGDLHLHTSSKHGASDFEQGFSREKIEEANRYARDVKQHDFIAVTNHDHLLKDWMWEVEKAVADEFTQAGIFVSFPAYEWTASRFCGRHMNPKQPDYPQWGHRNIYYRNPQQAPLLRCNDPNYDTPNELFRALPGTDVALTIPHHPTEPGHPFNWSTINPDYDRLVEIVQYRGGYERNVIRSGWNNGHILGVVGGSDNHDGKAGEPFKGSEHGGVTAILAPALTRDALFNALINRHTYATTHGDIILHFWGDGEIQGSILSQRSSIRLKAEIESRGGDISLVELLDNGAVITRWQPNQTTFQFEKTQEISEEQHYFYVKVALKNNHQAWSSPIWVNYLTPTPEPTPPPIMRPTPEPTATPEPEE